MDVAVGQHACGEPSRSTLGAAMLRLLYDRSQAGELIGDRAYDSDPLDEELRQRRNRDDRAASCQSEASSPHKIGDRLSSYMRRWLVERS